MDNNKDFAYKLGYLAAGVLVILSTLVLMVLGVAAVKLLIWVMRFITLIALLINQRLSRRRTCYDKQY